MPEVDMNRLEVDRVLNLVQGFGWEKTNEELTDEHIILTIRKKKIAPETPLGTGPG